MKKINWTTTLFGAGSVFTGLAMILKGEVQMGVTAVLCGIGLIFAKDFNNLMKNDDKKEKNS